MSSQVFFADSNELATLGNTFTVAGNPTDPTTVSLVVTDPTGTATSYAYNPGTIQRTGTGVYAQTVGCTMEGLWQYVWKGTGADSDVAPGTFTVYPVTVGRWYCSVEEIKSRLKISSANDDLELTNAVQAAARDVEKFTGRYFWQGPDTRTYVPEDLTRLTTDDIVSVSSLTLDFNGTGVYDQTWVLNTDYVLEVSERDYNNAATGEQRPYTVIKAIGGRFFPYIWPFARQDRVKITGVYGWPAVPPAVKQAATLITCDLFKLREAPFGAAGFGEYQVAPKSTDDPIIANMLRAYVSSRRKVGV